MEATKLWRWLMVAVVVVALAPGDALARLQDATPAEETYIAPDRSYTVPIPPGWTVEEGEGVVVVTGPDGELRVSVVVIAGTEADAALGEAMGIAEPDYVMPESSYREEPPAPPGVDRLVVRTFAGADGGEEFVQAIAQVVGETTYVVVIRGPLQEVTARDSQIGIIYSGLEIAAVDRRDLTGLEPAAFDDEIRGELEAYIERLLEDYGIPGASMVVVQDDAVVYAEGFGVTEAGGTPVDADTRMMIGSTTKSMTTMMAATRVDDGLVTWDTPVVDVLPYFAVADPELSETITLRNLFCACSGVPRRDLEFIFNANDLSAEDLIRSLAEFEFATGFGETFQYSNQMVAAGGYAAARAGNDDPDLAAAYREAMHERIFEPIGMGRTTLDFDAVEADGNYAIPHGQTLQVTLDPITVADEATLEVVAPAGAVWSTAGDLGRYLITALNQGVAPDGTRVVSEANLAETWEPQVQIDARSSYGLGWILTDLDGIERISHGGNTLGFTSELAFLPDVGIGLAILANGQAVNGFTAAVEERLYELLFDLPQTYDENVRFELEGRATLVNPGADLPAGRAEALLGDYRNEILGDVAVTLDGDGVPVLDAGEFRSRLRLTTAVLGTLVSWDPPFAGGEIELDGETLVVTAAGERFRFVRLNQEGTPVASPVGSPIATPVAATPVAA